MSHGITIIGKVLVSYASAINPSTHTTFNVEYVVRGNVAAGEVLCEVLNTWTDQEMELSLREQVAAHVALLSNLPFTSEDVRGCKI